MNNLKPLNWSMSHIARTPFRTYTIKIEGGEKVAVDYQGKHGQPATGFEAIDDAKAWAFEHYAKEMQPYVELDTSQQIVNWFRLAKPEPTDKDICTQIGCHYEEVSEMDLAMDAEHGDNEMLANWYKQVSIDMAAYVVSEVNSVELIDALCDQIVTAIGVGYMMGFDMQGALREVIRSNNSKFEDGKPLFNEQGKIMKGKGYSEPDLTPFLNKGE